MTSILKVGEIQDPTNGNTALEVDSSGFVKVTQCHFMAAWRQIRTLPELLIQK